MNTIKKYILLILVAAVGLTACEEICDYNTDEYNPPYIHGGETDEPDTPDKPDPTNKYADLDISYSLNDEALAALKSGEKSVGSIFSNFTYEGLYNDYQITTSLTHDIYAGYVANNKSDFNFNSPSYSYTDGWSSARWRHFYADRTSSEYATLIRTFHFVDQAKYKNAFYITRIYWAFLASMNTDTYGAMPLQIYATGHSVGDSIPYNTQEECYDIIFRMLEQAVDSIQPGACEFTFSSDDDRCYGGNEEKWLRFANSLRLRLAMRISNVNPQRAQAEGEAAMANQWGLMQSDEDRMRTVPKHAPVDQGGIGAGGDENVMAMCSFYYNGDCVLSKDLEDAYRNQSTGGSTYQVEDLETGDMVDHIIDPRCIISWWRPTALEELKNGTEWLDMDFTGCEIGNTSVNHTTEEYSVTRTDILNDKVLDPTKWFSASRESVWMGYAEVKFLLAEAALRGWAGTTGTPEELFKEGIRASMTYYEIASSDIDSYISNLKIYKEDTENPFEVNNKEGQLEQIISQKWIAVFPNGNEGWAEFRRTDYPALRNILTNSSSGEVADGKFIKRIKYPFSEKDNKYKPQADLQGDKLWWDVADTNSADGTRLTPNNFSSIAALRYILK